MMLGTMWTRSDARRLGTQRALGLDELLSLRAEHERAADARVVRHERDRDDDDRRSQRRAEQGDQRQRQDDPGNACSESITTISDVVEPAAEVAGEHAQEQAEPHRRAREPAGARRRARSACLRSGARACRGRADPCRAGGRATGPAGDRDVLLRRVVGSEHARRTRRRTGGTRRSQPRRVPPAARDRA